MKIRVSKATLKSYWYANKLGQEFEVEPNEKSSGFEFKVVNDTKYFNKNDVEVIKEDVQMFDLKKEGWYIRTPTPEISKLVQEWLFEQGLVWQYHKDNEVRHTERLNLMRSPFDANAFCFSDSIDPEVDTAYKDLKEIKITFKTVIDSVEYPKTTSPEQEKLDSILEQIKALQNEAQSLQQMMGE